MESLGLPNVRVMRQKNSGKPKALNAGIRAAQHDIVIMIDGDTVFEPDTVHLLVQPFADPEIGAVAGNAKIANRDELIGRMQHIEYVVGFNIDRRVQDVTGSIITVPGAGGAFRRKALLQVGGLSTDTLAEDTDLTIALGRAGWRVVFEERARAWTEAPATMAQLWKQRYRWSYGTMQAMWKHRRAIRERAGRARSAGAGSRTWPPSTSSSADRAAGRRVLPLRPGVRRPGADAAARRRHVGRAAAHGGVRVPSGARAARRALGLPRAAGRLPAADVLGAHPLGRERGERGRGALAADEPHRRAQQPAAQATGFRRARPARGERPPSALALLSGNELQRRRESKSTSDTAPVAAVTGRERWLDLLKVAALARVIASEVGAPAYLSLFPAWGVLFGIGGSMMARSAQHEPEVDVMGQRLRRVLVPLWAFGIVAVPLMLWQGWGTATDENTFYVSNLVFWIFPFLDPPGSTAAEHFTGGLWYIRACLWFVLLTPVMRAGMRRSPLVAMLLPLVVVGLDAWLNWDLSSGGGTGPALMDFCIYAPCWMFGMAYRDGSLRGIQRILVGVLAVVALAGGAAWTKLHVPGLNIDDVPLSAALVSFGVVVPLLSVSPLMAWMDRVPVLRELLWLITGRALTIYLCFPIAIAAAPLIAARLKLGTDARTATFITVGLVVLATLAFGWVEDLAARRPLGLLPRAGRRKKRKDKPAGQRPPVPQVAQAPAVSQQVRSPLGSSGPQEVPVLQGVGGPPVAGGHGQRGRSAPSGPGRRDRRRPARTGRWAGGRPSHMRADRGRRSGPHSRGRTRTAPRPWDRRPARTTPGRSSPSRRQARSREATGLPDRGAPGPHQPGRTSPARTSPARTSPARGRSGRPTQERRTGERRTGERRRGSAERGSAERRPSRTPARSRPTRTRRASRLARRSRGHPVWIDPARSRRGRDASAVRALFPHPRATRSGLTAIRGLSRRRRRDRRSRHHRPPRAGQ